MNKSEHLEWCKKRALKYIDNGELTQAYVSMTSDMQMHSETKDNPAIPFGMRLIMAGHLNTPQEMRKFIKDFN